MDKRTVKTTLMHTDDEILEDAFRSIPWLIAIDAPFSLPKKESSGKP